MTTILATKDDILGIDPGLDGGIVRLSPEGSLVGKWIMPTIDAVKKKAKGKTSKSRSLDLAALSNIMNQNSDVKHCYMESVSARPGQGVSSMFKFGRVFGNLESMLVAHKIAHTLVTPPAWTKIMHKGLDKSLEPKKRSQIIFNRLFPAIDLRKSERAIKPHDGLLDALLIAEYGRRDILGIMPQ